MRVLPFLTLLALPLLSAAQSSNNTQATTTAAPTSATQSGSATDSGSFTGSANVTATSAGNATTTANVTSILPTAPSSVPGENGDGPNGAPSPGTTASGGIYGPPDGYIAGAEAIRSAGILGLVGFAVGGALIFI